MPEFELKATFRIKADTRAEADQIWDAGGVEVADTRVITAEYGELEQVDPPVVTEVRPNHEQQVYVIPSDDGYSCLGFDNALDELDRVTIELVGRGRMTHKEQVSLMGRMRTARGHIVVWAKLQQHREQLRLQCEADGEQAVFNLSPQLQGFEGQVVEVEDVHDAPRRRFIVGRSTGWAPCHLEIELDHDEELEPGHDPASREYHHVEAPYEQ